MSNRVKRLHDERDLLEELKKTPRITHQIPSYHYHIMDLPGTLQILGNGFLRGGLNGLLLLSKGLLGRRVL
jgi:hypothetical protein